MERPLNRPYNFVEWTSRDLESRLKMWERALRNVDVAWDDAVAAEKEIKQIEFELRRRRL